MSRISKKPHIAIALDEAGIVAINAERAVSSWILKECGHGSVLNLSKDSIKEPLRDLVNSLSIKGREVSLSIPDFMAKTMIIELEDEPAEEKELYEMIRWKAAKAAYMKPEECSIGYKALIGKRFLTVIVNKQIIEDFEGIFLSIGLEPKKINIHSLNVFNLFSESIADGNFVIVIVWKKGVGDTRQCFSFMVFKDGVMDFLRSKEADKNLLVREVSTSFAFYAGKFPDFNMEKVYFFSNTEATEEIRQSIGRGITVVKPNSLFNLKEGLDIAAIDPLLILSAVGALC